MGQEGLFDQKNGFSPRILTVGLPIIKMDHEEGVNSNGFCPNQAFNSGWNKPNFLFDNRQQGGNRQNFNRNEPSLRDIIRGQLKINDDCGKRFHATNKLLKNIGAKMDNFTTAM